MKRDEHYFGLEEFRVWLKSQGFSVAVDPIGSRDNGCNWYAWRKTKLPARECECNEGKRKQVVVKPYLHTHPAIPEGARTSVTMDVTGEFAGVWFKLEAYSMRPDELMAQLDEIEPRLIAAWNALDHAKPE